MIKKWNFAGTQKARPKPGFHKVAEVCPLTDQTVLRFAALLLPRSDTISNSTFWPSFRL